MKKIFILFVAIMLSLPAFAKTTKSGWQNDLRTLFLRNQAIIYTINIRTFNAKDTNKNEIIDKDEESGNFINAIQNLDELVRMGVNTIHVLPITPIGKIKAFGTAGSLYAMTGFNSINPQLVSTQSSLSDVEQAKKFISEAHRRNIRVIIDLPSCGAYDYYLEHPEYFIKDDSQKDVVPLDWSDVRLFNVGTEEAPNQDLLNLHKQFIKFIISLGADGVRVDVAGLKPASFWESLIKFTKEIDSEFLFLAESSRAWTTPVSKYALCTPSEKLLEAGFDGYLGSYFNLKNWKTSKEFIGNVLEDLKLFNKYKEPKTVIGSFATHDEISPILVNGAEYSEMIIWLNTTLPLNAYYIDGFPTGDTYSYQWANKLAVNSQTDDEYYFTHNGKIDIFNFSRKPQGNDYKLYQEFVLANKFRTYYSSELSRADFKPLKTSNPSVFAYARVCSNFSLIVIGNLDFENSLEAVVKVPHFKANYKIINLRVNNNLENTYSNGKIKTQLKKGDIQVLLVKNLVF